MNKSALIQKFTTLDKAVLNMSKAVSLLGDAAKGDTAVYAIIDSLNAQIKLTSDLSYKIQAEISASSDDYSWMPNEPDFSKD